MSAASPPVQRGAGAQRSRRAALGVAAGLALLLVWVLVQGQLGERAARAAFPRTSGRLEMKGLGAPVDILRDGRGIPHIQAVRERDAWVALGFVHAQDRLAQMLWMRRLARGTTAEVIGAAGLESDRMARTLGIGFFAEGEIDRVGPEAMAILEAYAQGLNARIARIRSGEIRAPIALAERAAEIDDWRPSDTLAVFKLIAFSSSNLIETGVVLDDMIERLGSQLARPFRPTGNGVAGVEIPSEPPLAALNGSAGVGLPGELAQPSRALTATTGLLAGSAWVISGRHAESGAPLLVADLSLPTTSPPLVYEAHVRGGQVDMAGATIPGIPVVWYGRNLHVAWAATPARAVTVDLYKETVRDAANLYRNGTRWIALDVREELIRVRTTGGRLREEIVRVRSTEHGPLINALLRPAGEVTGDSRAGEGGPVVRPGGGPSEREPLALAWTGMRPGNGIESLLAVNRAPDADALVAALATHHEPVIAVVYTDTRGRAGLQLAGWLPQRILPTSLVPVPGRLRLFDWRAPIDYTALPARRIDASARGEGRSARAWIAAADGSLDDGLSAAGIEWLWRTGERDRRLSESLDEMTAEDAAPIDLRDAAAMQHDQVVGIDLDFIPALLRLALAGGSLRPEAVEIAQLLGRWDGDLSVSSRGGVAYQVLMGHLITDLFREPMGAALFERYLALPGVRPASIVRKLVLAADAGGTQGGWSDPARVRGAIRESLRETWVSLSYRLGPAREGWRWGGLHEIAFSPFAGEPRLRSWLGARGPRAAGFAAHGLGGDETTLGATVFDRVTGYAASSAAMYRMAVDLAAADRMLSGLAPGQSEHPGHPHFDDGVARWLEGRPSLLLTSRLLVEEESGERLLLEPAP